MIAARAAFVACGLAVLVSGRGQGVAAGAAARPAALRFADNMVTAQAGAAAPAFAANAEVARVGSERRGAERARAMLAELVRAVPLASGGTLGARMDQDAAVAARVADAVARARVVDVIWSSDGGALVRVGVPLETLRLAVEPEPAPQADRFLPTTLIVDARSAKLSPALGWRIEPAKHGSGRSYGVPITWVTAAPAKDDPRWGARPQETTLAGTKDGSLLLGVPVERFHVLATSGVSLIVIIREDSR